MVRHQHRLDVFRLEPLLQQVEVHREREAGDGVDLAVGQHRLAHREADILDLHLGGVDVVLMHERLPLREGAVRRGRAEHLALEVLGLGDAGLGGGGDRERRLVVHHQHRLDVLVGVLVLELDQRVDVEEADRIGAGGHARDAGDRAGAGVDRDVEPFGLVVALVDGDEVGRRRSLEFPVEGELHVGLRRSGAGRDGHRCSREHHENSGRSACVDAPCECLRPAHRRAAPVSNRHASRSAFHAIGRAICHACLNTRHFAALCLFPRQACRTVNFRDRWCSSRA